MEGKDIGRQGKILLRECWKPAFLAVERNIEKGRSKRTAGHHSKQNVPRN